MHLFSLILMQNILKIDDMLHSVDELIYHTTLTGMLVD